MLAIIIPAHNEEVLLRACLDSCMRAANDPALEGESVQVIVVADSCSDRTELIAAEFPVIALSLLARNVGAARAAGAAYALELGARWLAFTDADSVVPANWLSRQLACRADAVCGVIDVHDWSAPDAAIHRHFACTYHPVDGHRHIHGANLGLSAEAYQRAGGFSPLRSNEDVDLVKRLERSNAAICWTAQTKVWTSSRSSFRAPDGFGATSARVRLMVTGAPGLQDEATTISHLAIPI